MMKKCKNCSLEKEITSFVKNKICKDGYENTCKNCKNEKQRKYRKKIKYKNYRNEYNKKYKEREKEMLQKRKEKDPFLYRSKILYNGMRDRARNKSIDFDKNYFTKEYIMKRLIDYPYCECCKTKFDIDFKSTKRFNDNSPSMDRVNSKQGYIKGNVAIICWKCNKHKQDSNSKELRMIADFIDNWGNEV